jgi:hypothetical protein
LFRDKRQRKRTDQPHPREKREDKLLFALVTRQRADNRCEQARDNHAHGVGQAVITRGNRFVYACGVRRPHKEQRKNDRHHNHYIGLARPVVQYPAEFLFGQVLFKRNP